MKIKPASTNDARVWVVEIKHKLGPVLVVQRADGSLVTSMFIGKRKASAIARQWQLKWPKLSWQSGKPPKVVDMKTGTPFGTDFQLAVWAKAAAIPKGTILSYQDIARAIGKPKAMRAVGTAMKACPLYPFIPCHRVVGANGTLGGYGSDVATKRALLKAEGIILSEK
ncbi:MAG: methylated-DNA--[protein]-cysteine S-methyltransferase [Bdellovibrionales bacterium]